MAERKIVWGPLESNPETLTSYIQKLGVSNNWGFSDVFGLDEELLCMVPQPSLAFILLFPITENYKKHYVEEKEKILREGQEVSKDVFFMKQTIGNACGTIGVIHSLANSFDKIDVKKESPLAKFMNEVKGLSAEEIGKALEGDVSFAEAHTNCAASGQTAPMEADTKVDLHFVALIQKNGSLYELDGRKDFPINHGPSSDKTFLVDAAKVCKKFMALDESEMRFTILSLGPTY